MNGQCFIATSTFAAFDEAPLRRLEKAGFKVVLNPYGRRLSPEETMLHYAESSAVLAGGEKVDNNVLLGSEQLRVISRCGTGLDNIALEFAQERGIRVVATASPARAVAELVLGLILAARRHICTVDREMRFGKWRPRYGDLLQGKQAAVVGLGQIGREVCVLLRGLGMDVIGCDPEPPFEFCRDHKIDLCALDEALGLADVISIHIPLNENTRGLLGKVRLERCKPGALLVNTSRGEIVDEEALLLTLRNGYLGGAALDVFGNEPYSGPLTELSNVVLTPHMGSYAQETRKFMEADAVENLLVAWREIHANF